MVQVQPAAAHPHGELLRRDLWDAITSAVGNAFDGDDKTTSTTSTSKSDKKTAVKTVYTTDTPSGYTGALTTKTTAKTTAKTTSTTSTTSEKATTTTSSKTTAKTTAKTTSKTTDVLDKDTSTKLTTSITATTAGATDTILAVDTKHTTTQTSVSATAAAASASATTSSTTTGTTSTAAKAGISIGVLAGIFFVFMIVFFLFRKRQKQSERQRIADDEKMNGPFADSNAIGGRPNTNKPMPRLSLRPVTQFLPTLGGGAAAGAGAGSQYDNSYPDRRQSRGTAIAMQNTSPMANRPQGASAWERPLPGSGNNPFGDDAQRLNSPFSPSQHGFPGNRSPSPGSTDANGISPVSPVFPGGVAGAAAVGAAAGATAGTLARKASIRKDGPNALDLTLQAPRNGNLGPVPPSPAGTEYSMNSLAPGQPMGPTNGDAAIASAGGPAVSTVHRVQLDFKPTLEDELELRAGQLVRLLHEYDDGWALCIRLDRSRQGVVPRTCLSTRPVKPRPPPGGARPGPPINPNGQNRPITPQGGPNRRMGPGPNGGPMGGPMGVAMGNMGQGPRPQSPANRPRTPQGGPPQSMMNRSQSPYRGPPGAGGRSMSPAPGGIGRPQSPAELSGGGRSQPPVELASISRPQPPAELAGPTPRQSPAELASDGRPQSPSGMGGRRVTPPGPTQMSQQMSQPTKQPMRPTNSIGRKPVPGQAY